MKVWRMFASKERLLRDPANGKCLPKPPYPVLRWLASESQYHILCAWVESKKVLLLVCKITSPVNTLYLSFNCFPLLQSTDNLYFLLYRNLGKTVMLTKSHSDLHVSMGMIYMPASFFLILFTQQGLNTYPSHQQIT